MLWPNKHVNLKFLWRIPAAEKAFAAAVIGKDARLILSRYDTGTLSTRYKNEKIIYND